MANLLTAEHLSKSYGMKLLFDDIDFGMDTGEKIGLIGVNGTGKSSFLRVIAGLDAPDRGKLAVGQRMRIEYLPQTPEFDEEMTVLQYIYDGDAPAMQAVREYEAVRERLADDLGDMKLQQRLVELSGRMDALGAWQLESEAKKILTKLGIFRFAQRLGTLSGGQKKRVALARALIHPADLLILDEPTNHIDNDTVDWLEQYLQRSKAALLMVTHDRYFLDRVAVRMIELDGGKLYSYSGNYSEFLELKQARLERQHASELKRQNLLRNELAWIRRGAKARTTKQKARIDRFEKLMEQGPEARAEQVDMSVGATRLGRKVIELESVGKSVGADGKPLIRDFTYTVRRDDRIGIIGPNGSGKSTLLNMIAGRLQPDDGVITVGETVKIGYFSQENAEFDGSKRVIEYIKEAAEVITTADGGTVTAAQMLERFLFPPGLQWTPVSKLSGGEKRRLYLLRVLMEAPNVLLLDEPTNDLDIDTLTVLEQYLDEFPGAVLVVSHDRYFLDRVAETIFAFEGEGRIRYHVGNYSEYADWLRVYGDGGTAGGIDASSASPGAAALSAGKSEAQGGKDARPAQERAPKFSFKEQREYEQIDGLIEGTEAMLREVTARIDEAGGDYMLLQELNGEQQKLQEQIDQLLERWTYLNELAEQIAAYSKTKP